MRKLTVILTILACAGCGTATYEQRLSETVKYYKYRNELDRVLQPTIDGHLGVRLRVPHGFAFIPPPAPAKPEEDEAGVTGEAAKEPEEIAWEDDPRQPSYLPSPLPGLVAVYQAKIVPDSVTAAAPGGSDTSEPDNNQPPANANSANIWIHIFCNAVFSSKNQTLTDAEGKPLNLRSFNEEMQKLIPEALNLPVDLSRVESFRVPEGNDPTYDARRDYTYIGFELPGTDQFANQPAQLELYQTDSNGVQVTILVARPIGLSPRSIEAVGLERMLETVTLDNKLPTPQEAAARKRGGSQGSTAF